MLRAPCCTLAGAAIASHRPRRGRVVSGVAIFICDLRRISTAAGLGSAASPALHTRHATTRSENRSRAASRIALRGKRRHIRKKIARSSSSSAARRASMEVSSPDGDALWCIAIEMNEASRDRAAQRLRWLVEKRRTFVARSRKTFFQLGSVCQEIVRENAKRSRSQVGHVRKFNFDMSGAAFAWKAAPTVARYRRCAVVVRQEGVRSHHAANNRNNAECLPGLAKFTSFPLLRVASHVSTLAWRRWFR